MQLGPANKGSTNNKSSLFFSLSRGCRKKPPFILRTTYLHLNFITGHILSTLDLTLPPIFPFFYIVSPPFSLNNI